MKSVKKLTKEIWTLRTSVDKQTRLVTELSSSVSGLKKENNHLREKVGSLKYRLKSQKRNSPITLVEPIKENLF
jgi:predicted RNase H-like nuclease (RuvC/YqgF family)